MMLRRWRTWLFVVAWLLLIAGFWLVAQQRGQSPAELLVEILQGLQTSRYAVLWLLLIYVIRPLFLLPVSVLTVFAGFLFGAVYGTLWSMVAAVGSAALAYGLARFVAGGRRIPQGKAAAHLRENAFEARSEEHTSGLQSRGQL